MKQGLAVKYRPSEFDDMVGQDVISKILSNIVETEDCPRAMLFSGTSGTGKTTAARIVANKVAGDETSVIEVDAASHGGVSDVRDLVNKVKFSMGTDSRVIIIDEAHSLTRDAFNALLTTLEDPPEGVVFILITTEAHKIPKTIASRLITFEFRPVSVESIYQRLKHVATEERIDIEDKALAVIALHAEGNIRKSLQYLELSELSSMRTRADVMNLLGVFDAGTEVVSSMWEGDLATTYEILDKVLASSGSPVRVLSDIVSVFKNIFILRSGGKLPFTSLSTVNTEELAKKIDTPRAMAACRVLWELQSRVKDVTDPRTDLELSIALVAEILNRGRATSGRMDQDTSKTAETAEDHTSMSLSEMTI